MLKILGVYGPLATSVVHRDPYPSMRAWLLFTTVFIEVRQLCKYIVILFWSASPVFPNLFRLTAPCKNEIYFAAPSGGFIAICRKVWWHWENALFDDILKNVLARGTPEYREWHPGWETQYYKCRNFCIAGFNLRWSIKPNKIEHFINVFYHKATFFNETQLSQRFLRNSDQTRLNQSNILSDRFFMLGVNVPDRLWRNKTISSAWVSLHTWLLFRRSCF